MQAECRGDRESDRQCAQVRALNSSDEGRAISSRMANRPIAIITVTNIAQRAISNCGVVAVADMFGTRNCGAGPGLGPTA